MKILAVDCSAICGSMCVIDDGLIICESFINVKLTHSQTLMPMIDSCLKNAMVDIKDIDAFAVSNGPGSFTGIRIGISIIKGLAMALDKPCIAVSTLEAIAYNYKGFNATICSVMDARCNQLYNAIFKASDDNIARITQDRAISIDNLKEELLNMNDNVILVGDGASLCYNTLGKNLKNIKLAPIQLRYQHATGVALKALELAKLNEYTSYLELVPSYLRLSQAERELKKKNSQKGV